MIYFEFKFICYIFAHISLIKTFKMATKTKRERFEEVAGSRVQMIMDKIENLSKCANKRNYEFEKRDVDKMFRAINEEVKKAKALFDAELSSGNKEKKVFKF